MKPKYSSRQISDRIGIEKYNLRFYEKEGLFKIRKDNNGYREYTEDDVCKANVFMCWNSMGFSIKDSISHVDNESINKVNKLIDKQDKELDRELAFINARKHKCVFYKNTANKYLHPDSEEHETGISDFVFFSNFDRKHMEYLNKIGLNEYIPLLYHGILYDEGKIGIGYFCFNEDIRLLPEDFEKITVIHHCHTGNSFFLSAEKEADRLKPYSRYLQLYTMLNIDGVPFDESIVIPFD